MVFDRNRTNFSDCIQEKIFEIGASLVPLEITLPFVPDELKSACKDLYNFTYNILSDMYENADIYGFSINKSETDYINKKQVEFYFWIIGGFNNLIGNKCEMPINAFNKLTKKFNPKSVEALKRHGFVFTEKNDIVEVSNSLYPDMLIATKSIGDAGYSNYKVNKDYFLMYCDFRAFSKYRRTYEDLFSLFNDKNRHIVEEIHSFSVSNKIMPQKCDYYFRVDYKKKGKVVFMANIAPRNELAIYIDFNVLTDEPYKTLETEASRFNDSDNFNEFIRNNLKKCSNCYPDCDKNSKIINFGGKRTFSCKPYFSIINPSEQDLIYVLRLIEFRASFISN